jgi:hypothetical protein
VSYKTIRSINLFIFLVKTIFWAAAKESIKVFHMQKKVIQIMVRRNKGTSCRIFNQCRILTLPSLYIWPHYTLLNKWVTIWKGTSKSMNIILEAKIKFIFQHAKQPYFRIMCYAMQSDYIINYLKELRVFENFRSFKMEVKSLLITNTLCSVHEFLNSSFN